ncbi:phosphatase PAP2 family protein [Streptomyces sp. NPDC001941]|uniref:phosphatase PAP2 family protein n=1 Tax=Streptomyces sp. NPDC001941 TaxID=3154659 RepID=UPI0033325859
MPAQGTPLPRTTSAPALVSGLLLAFAALHLVTVWTPPGQWAENALIRGYADQARALPLTGPWGLPPLTHEEAAVAAGLALIAVVTAVRRCWRAGCTAVATLVVTTGGTEALKRFVFVRPDLVGADDNLTEASFPSGHVAITAALALGFVAVASPRLRGGVAALGALWVAVAAGAVQALYWHRPSDVLGAVLLACACYAAARHLIGTGPAPDAPRRRATLPLVLSAVGALVAASRTDAVARPLVFSAAAFVCAVLVWWVATRPASEGAAAVPERRRPARSAR